MLTCSEAAMLASVTTSTIERWVDKGILPVVNTVDGKRLFERHDIERLMSLKMIANSRDDSEINDWVQSILAGNRLEIDGRLLMARIRLGSWCHVADELGMVLWEIGRLWQEGQLTIADEHRASATISRAISRVGDLMPEQTFDTRCLLACAGNDEHTLGLSLAELCLREHGLNAIWLGRQTPVQEVIRLVDAGQVELVALSASIASNDAADLAQIADTIGAACKIHEVGLVLGGSGAWPDEPTYGRRITSFSAFHELLESGKQSNENRAPNNTE